MATSTGQQTTVAASAAPGFAGQLGEGDFKTRSYHNEEATASMPFGVMLARGTANEDEGALLAHTDAATMAGAFIGVSLHSHHYDEDSDLGADPTTGVVGLKADRTVNVLTHGTVWVVPEDGVDPGDLVKVRAVATGTEQKGAFRATADDTDDCVDVSAFCRWLTTATAGQPALLEINMTLAAQGVADS